MSKENAEPLDIALDQALTSALSSPELPRGFRGRLQAALTQTAALDPAAARRALELEHDQQLSTLRSEFVRLRRRTLGRLIGVAFCAGAGVAVAMPWIMRNLESAALVAISAVGGAVGIAIGLAAWLRRDGVVDWQL